MIRKSVSVNVKMWLLGFFAKYILCTYPAFRNAPLALQFSDKQTQKQTQRHCRLHKEIRSK